MEAYGFDGVAGDPVTSGIHGGAQASRGEDKAHRHNWHCARQTARGGRGQSAAARASQLQSLLLQFLLAIALLWFTDAALAKTEYRAPTVVYCIWDCGNSGDFDTAKGALAAFNAAVEEQYSACMASAAAGACKGGCSKIIRQSQTNGYAYDGASQFKRVTKPDGGHLGFDYDPAHRQTAVYDNLGNRIEYLLDNAGNLTAENVKDTGGALRRQLARSIDALGRVQQTTGRE